jgi:hypothetical protein
MVHILFLATSALLTAIAPWCDTLREAGGAPDDWVRARCPSVAAAPAGVPFDFFEAVRSADAVSSGTWEVSTGRPLADGGTI